MSRAGQRGFSLFQGVVVLAIVTITAMSSAPLYYRLIGDRHVVAYTNELVGELQNARHMAVTAMSPVSLCSSVNGRDCTQTPWSDGYIAFYDGGRPGVVDGDDRVVRVVQPRKLPVRVVLNGADHIRFQNTGAVLADAAGSVRARVPSRIESTGTWTRLARALSPVSIAHAATPVFESSQPVAFLVCSGQIGRAIRVTAVGRVDTSTVACQ